jgi:hypothetical protein
MIINTDDLSAFMPYAADLIRLGLKEQAKHEARKQQQQAAAAEVEWSKILATEPRSEVVEEIEAELAKLEQRISDGGISREPHIGGAGQRHFHPLVVRLHDAQRRLKAAVEKRDRMKALGL